MATFVVQDSQRGGHILMLYFVGSECVHVVLCWGTILIQKARYCLPISTLYLILPMCQSCGRLQSLDWTSGLDWWTGLVDWP